MKRMKNVAILLAVVASLSVAGCGIMHHGGRGHCGCKKPCASMDAKMPCPMEQGEKPCCAKQGAQTPAQ